MHRRRIAGTMLIMKTSKGEDIDLDAEVVLDTGPNKRAIAKLVFALALVVLFVTFAAQNTTSVDVEFVSWEVTMDRVVLMGLSAAGGIAVWELASFRLRRLFGR